MPFGLPPEANSLKSGFIALPLARSRVSAFERRPSCPFTGSVLQAVSQFEHGVHIQRAAVRTFPAKPGIFTALDRMMFLIVEADKAGIYAFSKAAAPATCGADIEVPFLGVYPPCGPG